MAEGQCPEAFESGCGRLRAAGVPGASAAGEAAAVHRLAAGGCAPGVIGSSDVASPDFHQDQFINRGAVLGFFKSGLIPTS